MAPTRKTGQRHRPASEPSLAEGRAHYVYGRHIVALLLGERQGQVLSVLVAESRSERTRRGAQEAGPAALAALAAQAEGLGIATRAVPEADLDALSEGGVHQGVVAEVRPFAYAPFASLLEGPLVPLVLVLDQIQDPRNLGALVRSAKAFGASGVLVPSDRSAPMSGAAIKASAGAAYLLPVARAVNLRRALDALAEAGVWRCGLSADATKTVRQIDWRGPSAVVVGAEGSGLRRLTREACDHLARLPAPHMESLNAAVAGSLALYEAAAQRQEA